jgi:hypothetical protein
VEHLPGVHEVLYPIPALQKNKNKKITEAEAEATQPLQFCSSADKLPSCHPAFPTHSSSFAQTFSLFW